MSVNTFAQKWQSKKNSIINIIVLKKNKGYIEYIRFIEDKSYQHLKYYISNN